MKKLGETIREIRSRRGETQSQFAKRLGIAYSMVSRYEADKVIPSRAVLYHLRGLAESAGQKEAIEAAVTTLVAPGNHDVDRPTDEAFIALAKSVTTDLNAIIRERGSSSATRETFRDLAVEMAGEKYIPLWMLETFKLWRRHRNEPGAEEEFAEAVTALDRRLTDNRHKRSGK